MATEDSRAPSCLAPAHRFATFWTIKVGWRALLSAQWPEVSLGIVEPESDLARYGNDALVIGELDNYGFAHEVKLLRLDRRRARSRAG